jgi:antitoxin component HigA of HigAB toxin-antitoxin module
MTDDKDPRDVLHEWIRARGCSVTWVAQQIGWSREMLSYVLHKKHRMSDKLARALREKLGIPVQGQPRRKPEAVAV